MKSYHLAFLAAALFAIASILSFINGSSFRGYIGIVGVISFVLAGIHWRKTGRRT